MWEKRAIPWTWSTLNILFEYISLFQALNIESLLGNIGGYVGMFLGVSLLQFPGLLSDAAKMLKSFSKSTTQNIWKE